MDRYVKNRPLKVTLRILIIIIISNLPPVSFIFGFFARDKTLYGSDYFYTSGSGAFLSRRYFGLSGSGQFSEVLEKFESHKTQYPADTILYRCFAKHPLKFWDWWIYLTDPKYQIPYKKEPPYTPEPPEKGRSGIKTNNSRGR